MSAADCAASAKSFLALHRPFALTIDDDNATVTFSGRTIGFPLRALGLLQFISAQTGSFERAALADISGGLTAAHIDMILGTLVREGLVAPNG